MLPRKSNVVRRIQIPGTRLSLTFLGINFSYYIFCFSSFYQIKALLKQAYSSKAYKPKSPDKSGAIDVEVEILNRETRGRLRKSDSSRIQQAVQAIALCHNVTPCFEQTNKDEAEIDRDENSVNFESETEADQFYGNINSYTYQVRA